LEIIETYFIVITIRSHTAPIFFMKAIFYYFMVLDFKLVNEKTNLTTQKENEAFGQMCSGIINSYR